MLARDIGFDSGRDLLVAAGQGPEGAALIGRMVDILGLDMAAIEASNPGLVRQLQIACSTCQNKRTCECELNAGTAKDTYGEFCPNADSLKQLPG